MKLFNDLEAEHGLPKGLLNAVMKQESGGNTRAVSPKGARGAFQFMPATAKQYGVDVNDLTSSAKGAARMYADLLKQNGGDLNKALAGYNWGQGNVQRKGLERMPAETRQYIQKVTANMKPVNDPREELIALRRMAELEDKAAQASQSNPQAAAPKPDGLDFSLNTGKVKAVGQGIKDAVGGVARSGMGIASNLMRPFEAMIPGGDDGSSGHKSRMARVEGRFKSQGYDPESTAFQGGKLGGDIAATLPVGGALGRLAGNAPAIQSALRTGGLTTGNNLVNATRGARALDMGTRVAGGVATGGAMAGIVDTDSAGTGALIGGALPPALRAAGAAGGAIRQTISGPAVPEQLRRAVESARAAGYVIPPSQAKPTLVNRALEGFSGKITTAQNASARNQPVTQALIARELGLPAGTPVSRDALMAIRAQAGNAYEAVGSTGVINTTPAYQAALNGITASARRAASGFPNARVNPLIDEIESLRSQQFDASSAVAKIRELRGAADSAYASGNRELGGALRAGSAALEDAIETHLRTIGAPQSVLTDFRDARRLIAQTYSVEKAMNATTGNVDAAKLGNQLAKGKPLSGGIRDVAAFGQQFPKAAQSIERMGSLPQTSPLDWGAFGTMSALTSNPLLMAGVLARPAARSAVLSGPVQNRLATPQGNGMGNLLMDPRVQQLLYRSAPVASAQ